MTAAAAAFSKEELKARFLVGKQWEEYVCEKLVEEDIPAEMTCEGWIEGANVRQLTEEDQDIVIPTDGEPIVIEVKSRHGKTQFGWEPESYPYDTAIVETLPGWNAKKVKPDYYVLVSADSGAILVADENDHEHWLEGLFYDSYERKRNRCLVVPIEHLKTWDWFIDDLKRRLASNDKQ